jgi:type VI secretion system secreted protein VgrG
MEVVIQFVDGNPDQPVVVGTLYNSVNEPPYTMPDEKTKSTIKTSSSLGGDGYNELTFEDAAGDEEIIVHAQKDFNKTVLNNQSRSVGANDSTSVGGDQSLSVSGDRTHSVSGNETLTITGSQKVTISGASTGDGQTVTGGQLDITGEYKVDASESIDIKAPNYIELRVGDTFIKIEPDKITMQQKDGCKTVLSPDSALMASKENSQVLLNADGQMQASTGGDLTLTADAQMTGQDAQVLLNGEAMVKAAGGGEVKLTGDATMSGTNARVDGSTAATVSGGSEATLTASGSTVKTAGAGADVSGPQVNIAGSGAVNVTGGIIKLN